MVAVETAGQLAFGIVQMNAAEIAESDDPVEFVHGGFIAFRGFDVVAGGEGVAGVDADADSAFVVDQFDDPGKMLKAVAEVAALTSCVFDDGCDPFRFRKRRVDAFCNEFQTVVLGDELQMASGVKVQPIESELLAAGHFIGERLQRLLPFFRIGISHVD